MRMISWKNIIAFSIAFRCRVNNDKTDRRVWIGTFGIDGVRESMGVHATEKIGGFCDAAFSVYLCYHCCFD